MTKVVVDASAFLALIQQEDGAEKMQQYLPNACISSVNVAEILTILMRNGLTELQTYEIISNLLEDIRDFDLVQAKHAAKLYPQTKQYGLSLGDRACIALAIQTERAVITADKIWCKLNLDNEIILIR